MSKRLRDELKFRDHGNSGSTLLDDWRELDSFTEDSISGVPQGDGECDRDGRTYLIHSLRVTGLVTILKGEGISFPYEPNVVRIIVFLDTQTNGAQFAPLDVMGVSSFDYLGFKNLSNDDRFVILHDETIDVVAPVVNEGAQNLFATAGALQRYEADLVFDPPIKVTCSGSTINIDSISDNSLHIMGVAKELTPICSHCFSSRIRFTG